MQPRRLQLLLCMAALVVVSAVTLAGWLALDHLKLSGDLTRARSDQRLASLEIRALSNQLEAERLLARGEIALLRTYERRIVKLTSPSSTPASGEPGAIIEWSPLSGEGVVRFASSTHPSLTAETLNSLHLWFAAAPDAAPVSCASLKGSIAGEPLPFRTAPAGAGIQRIRFFVAAADSKSPEKPAQPVLLEGPAP